MGSVLWGSWKVKLLVSTRNLAGKGCSYPPSLSYPDLVPPVISEPFLQELSATPVPATLCCPCHIIPHSYIQFRLLSHGYLLLSYQATPFLFHPSRPVEPLAIGLPSSLPTPTLIHAVSLHSFLPLSHSLLCFLLGECAF